MAPGIKRGAAYVISRAAATNFTGWAYTRATIGTTWTLGHVVVDGDSYGSRGHSRCSAPATSGCAIRQWATGGSHAVPATWQTFSDLLGTYTLRFPPGWTAQGGVGAGGTVGDNFGSGTLTQEGFHFTDPSEGTGSAEVFISMNPIKTAFDHQWFCQAWPAKDKHATFHGIPALQIDSATWLFQTRNAAFQIDVSIPGVMEPVNPGGANYLTPLPTATPLPASWVATDQTDVNGTLASLQPSDMNPLAC